MSNKAGILTHVAVCIFKIPCQDLHAELQPLPHEGYLWTSEDSNEVRSVHHKTSQETIVLLPEEELLFANGWGYIFNSLQLSGLQVSVRCLCTRLHTPLCCNADLSHAFQAADGPSLFRPHAKTKPLLPQCCPSVDRHEFNDN